AVIAQIKASKSPRPGTRIRLENGDEFVVEGREQDFFRLVYTGRIPVLDLLQASGHIPLPPYIKREDAAPDYERYQTVYARQPGAVAAPTAGLHFSEAILALLNDKKVHAGFVTLHVGAGTFQPVRVDYIEEHRMHSEWFSISEDLCRQISRTRSAGGRVIAVGTTVVRCLESATRDNHPEAMTGETDIFIYPGYEFKLIDGLITNFHLPESTLLMLVSAFAGKDNVQRAYAHAITEKYRFFSYGDAMLIL
ncbi:MAG: tRNA preQ1(34) S-adenosylmethionine ribosyltransferase-isomerase QueA, partial [Gammaproteobacteria bacterium]